MIHKGQKYKATKTFTITYTDDRTNIVIRIAVALEMVM